MNRIGVQLVVLASLGLAITPTQLAAREFKAISGPYVAQYKTFKKIRSALRKKLKKGAALSGDDYYMLGVTCAYEPPPSQSIILTMMDKSPCKDQVVEYYIEAGMKGAPEGFYEAAKRSGTGEPAYLYAQLAYRLAGADAQLRGEALALMGEVRSSAGDTTRIDQQAEGMATQLASSGIYRMQNQAPSEAQLASAGLPQLNWLKFSNAKTCEWSATAENVLSGAYTFDDKRMTNITVPATTKLPGSGKPVRGRVSWPSGKKSNHVRINVDFKGRWNGLTVLGLTDEFLEESDGLWGKGIRFAEPVDVVARALAKNGFVVNADGSEREQADEVDTVRLPDERGRMTTYRNINGVLTSVTRRDGETVFLCNYVYQVMG